MDNKQILTFSEEDLEDNLSFCNLKIDGYEEVSRRPSTSSDPDLFEFFPGSVFHPAPNDSVLSAVNEYRKRDYLCLKSASFNKSEIEGREIKSARGNNNRSESLRFSSSRVNITALTSMSAKSRRRMFMFGPVKFKPEMDVNAIRKRQSRLAPVQIPPMPEEGEMVVASGGQRGKSGGDGGLVRPLRCRSHFTAALAKSLGCIPISMV